MNGLATGQAAPFLELAVRKRMRTAYLVALGAAALLALALVARITSWLLFALAALLLLGAATLAVIRWRKRRRAAGAHPVTHRTHG